MTRRSLGAVALVLCALAGPAFALDPQRGVTQYILESWGTERGLPHASGTSIAQTRDGYLWLGTGDGLVRFDGARLTVFDRSAISRDASWALVSALVAAHEGGLWFAGPGGQLVRLREGRFDPVQTSPDAPVAAITQLVEESSGALWAVYRDGEPFRLSGGRWERPSGLPGGAVVTSVCESPGGLVFVGTSRGLFSANGSRLSPVAGFPDLPVTGLGADPRGGLWVLTASSGLFRLDPHGGVETRSGQAPLPGRAKVLADRDGNVWLATLGRGLIRVGPRGVDAFTSRDGLPADVVDAIFEDAEGSLWLGLQGFGLGRLRDGNVVVYGRRQGISHDNVKTVLVERSGIVWAGTYGGGLDRLDPASGDVRVYTTRDGLTEDVIRTIFQGEDGALWVGTNTGVARRRAEGGSFEVVPGLGPMSVDSIAADRDGQVWAAGYTGGLVCLTDDPPRRLTGLRASQFGPLCLGREGSFWIGTYGAGLFRLRGSALTTIADTEPRLRSVLGLHEDGAGALWMGTPAGGLARLLDGRLSFVGAREGLIDGLVFELVEDGKGSVVVTTSQGIFVTGKEALDRVASGAADRLDAVRLGAGDGMPTQVCAGGSQPGVAVGPDGRVWVGTPKGLVVVDPSRLTKNPRPPVVHVEEVLVDGRVVRGGPQGPALVLPPGGESLELHYTALSLRVPERVRFRYRMEGLDRDWVEAGSRRTAYYTHLPHGRYVFHVLAANEDGVWTETGDRLGVTVEPSFVETPWFLLLVAVAASLLGVALYRFRIRTLEQRERELLALVSERTRELSLASQKTERALEEAERSRGEAEEASKAKSTFLASMSHELRTPLNAILGFVQLLLRDRLRADQREFLGIVSRSGEHLLGLINDVLSLSQIEAGATPVNEVVLDPGALGDGVVELLRVRAEAKGLRLAAEAPEGLPRAVRGDEGKLRQILLNLVGNAVKFTKTGSVTLRSLWREGHAVFEVIDTGPGLTEAELARLFAAFAQTESGRKAGEGSGLGLVLSRRYARLMGGDVTVRSEPGRGTTFRVEVPLPEASPRDLVRPSGRRRRVAGLVGERVSVLVVDDVAENRLFLGRLLSSVGFSVTEATDGREAIERWSLLRPALILMDVRMPVMDGLEATRRIRSLSDGTGPRILALSASVLSDERSAVRAAGCDDFLAKPFREDELFEKLAALLGLRYRYEEEPKEESQRAPGPKSAPGAASVLVVDDSPVNRRLASELLARPGLVVTEADGGRAALDLLAERSFDVVLLDVEMPDVDGVTVVRALRARPEGRELPVVALTAHAGAWERERLLAAGMSDYLPKPLDSAALDVVLRRWLGARFVSATTAAESSGLPALPRGIVAARGLASAGGNARLHRRVLDGWLAELPEAWSQIRGRLQRGEGEEARQAIHRLRGAAAAVGAERVAAAAREVEQALAGVPAADERLDVGELVTELADAITELGVRSEPTSEQGLPRADELPDAETARRALSVVTTLAAQLTEGSLLAVDTVVELRSVLGSRCAATLARLEDRIGRLEFDVADSELEALRSLLERAGS